VADDAFIAVVRDGNAGALLGEGRVRVAREVLPWLGPTEEAQWAEVWRLVAAHLERHGSLGVKGDYLEAGMMNGEKVWVLRATDGPDLAIVAARLPEGYEGLVYA
jgi:hypothetical protein